VKEKRCNEAVAAHRKIAMDSPSLSLGAGSLYMIALVHLFYDNMQKEYTQASAHLRSSSNSTLVARSESNLSSGNRNFASCPCIGHPHEHVVLFAAAYC
jgi:hypothetical protein